MNERKLRIALAMMHQDPRGLGAYEALIAAEHLMNKAATGDSGAQKREWELNDWAGKILVCSHNELLKRYENKVLT